MRLYARQKAAGKQDYIFGLQSDDQGAGQQSKEILLEQCENQYKFKEYFVYDQETNENQLYPSQDEAENVQLKTQLIRQHVKEQEVILDGLLIENIFEYPKETAQHLALLERERKSQEILNNYAQEHS